MGEFQPTFDEPSITREEWGWVEGLIRDVARDEKKEVFAQQLFQWDLAVQQFRKVEQKRVVLGSPTEMDLHFHALCLHGLLTIGRALVIASKDFSADELEKLRVRHGEIAAYVEDLEQSLREWHHGFTGDEVNRVREAVLGAEA